MTTRKLFPRRLGRFATPVAGVLVLAALMLAAAGCESGAFTEKPQGTDAGGLESEEAPPEEEAPSPAEPATEPIPKAPPPVVLKGNGATVESIRLRADSPLVVTGRHSGSANYIVELVPRGGGDSVLVFNEIGSYSGQAAVSNISRGRYRVRVDADGAWSLRFTQPVPTPKAKQIPGTVKGEGAKVIPIQVADDLQPVVTARHRGQANFIVTLIGYGDLSGELLVFNEIGNFDGETLIDDLPAGDYLLYVQADGSWRLKFAP
jgi:hypothetical protein